MQKEKKVDILPFLISGLLHYFSQEDHKRSFQNIKEDVIMEGAERDTAHSRNKLIVSSNKAHMNALRLFDYAVRHPFMQLKGNIDPLQVTRLIKGTINMEFSLEDFNDHNLGTVALNLLNIISSSNNSFDLFLDLFPHVAPFA